MSFLGTIATSLIGSLFGGGSKKQVAAPAPVQAVEMPSEEDDNAIIAWWEGWQRELQSKAPTTGYDPMGALFGAQAKRAPAPMQASSNQRGGQAYPGYYGQGLFQPGADGLGPGRGGSGTATENASSSVQQQWHDLLERLTGSANSQQYTAPLQSGFTSYMQQALAGQAGLPEEAYQQAVLSGQRTINAQAQQSRDSLAQQLGSRGLAASGLMSRGLRGVEEAKVQSVGDLLTGLAQQNMQARIEAQRQAAGMLPSLMSAQTSANNSIISSWLNQEQLDLERGRLGLAAKQQGQASSDAFWGALGSIAGSLFSNSGSSSSYDNK